ncbi:MAG: porin [Gammaproteobacteria bacterium]|nr:porin [Gammaproteobacteria bacterium]MCY4281778.1 porin [Gammaproteobacteria bacterium]
MYKASYRFLYTALLTAGLSVMSVPAHAANGALLELLKILKDKGSITQQEFELLRDTALAETGKPAPSSAAETPAQAAPVQTATAPAPQVVAAAKPSPDITTKGKLEFKTDEHKFRIGGRAEYDVTLVGNDGAGHVGNSEHQFRRARMFLSGTAWTHWDWKIQFDFEDADDGGMAIEDNYLRYRGWDPATIMIGQRRTSFSLGSRTSSKNITFLERAVPTNLFASEAIGIGGRAPGIILENAGKSHTFSSGFYLMRQRSASETDSITERKIDDGWGFMGQATWLPVHQAGNRLVHTGAGIGYKHYPNKTVQRFRVRPPVSEGDRIVDSDQAITADDYWSVNLEAASIWGPFAASAEYYYGDFGGTPALGATDMEGFYVQGSYFLTGESRGYKNGKFSGLKVNTPVGNGGWGAWELGLRYSHTDLGAGIGADSGNVLSAALNWYLNNNMIFRLNYVKTFCDNDGADTCDWGASAGDPHYLSFRTQVFF